MAFIANTQTGTGCSGTVISPMIVLTAAHCVQDVTSGVVQPASAFAVVTGRLDWTNTSGGQLLAVAHVIVHPGYALTTFGTDAALLILTTPTQAPAIALASSANAALRSPGAGGAIAGWGDTYGGEPVPPTTLQWATTVVQGSTYCAIQETTDGVAFDPAASFCAIDPANFTTAACHGDSGGPLLAIGPTTPIEIGITSRGDSKCDTQYPTVFTAVDTISTWANQWIANYPPPPPAPPPNPPPLTPPPTSSPTTTQPAPTPPAGGLYKGRTAQRHGGVALTLAPSGIGLTRVLLSFTLHCRHAPPRRYTESAAWRTPLTLTASSTSPTLWRFATDYTDAAHRRYTVAGQVQAPGTASGTVRITNRTGRCTTDTIAWTARH